MSRGKAYPPELKAAVIQARASGESLSAVAERFGVGKATVDRWWSEFGPVEPANQRTREELGALVYDAVAEVLRAVSAQARLAQSSEWLQAQSAADIAGLLSVELDRTIRLLTGLRPAADALPDPTDRDDVSPDGHVA